MKYRVSDDSQGHLHESKISKIGDQTVPHLVTKQIDRWSNKSCCPLSKGDLDCQEDEWRSHEEDLRCTCSPEE